MCYLLPVRYRHVDDKCFLVIFVAISFCAILCPAQSLAGSFCSHNATLNETGFIGQNLDVVNLETRHKPMSNNKYLKSLDI